MPLSARLMLVAAVCGSGLVSVVSAGRQPAASAVLPPQPATNPPVLAGDKFTYSLKSVVTTTLAGHPPTTYTQNVVEHLTAVGNATFAGHKNLIRLAVDLGIPNSLSYTFVGFVPAGSANKETLYGAQSIGKNGSETVTNTETMLTGQVIDEFPEVAGQHWPIPAAYTDVETDTGGPTTSRTVRTQNIDGSYSSVSTTVGPKRTHTNTQLLGSRGNARLTDTFTGYNTSSTYLGFPIALNTKFFIPVTISGGNALPSKPTPPRTVDVPDWFPSRDLAPFPLSTGVTLNRGLVTTPTLCGMQAGIKSYLLYSTSTTLDPLAGTYTITVDTEYDAPGLGDVCGTFDIASRTYDNGALGAGFGQGTGQIVASTTESGVSILTSETGPKPLGRALVALRPFALYGSRPVVLGGARTIRP